MAAAQDRERQALDDILQRRAVLKRLTAVGKPQSCSDCNATRISKSVKLSAHETTKYRRTRTRRHFQCFFAPQEVAKEKEAKDELQQERNSYAQKVARITTRETAAAVAAAEREERLKALTLELRQDLTNAASTTTNVSSLLAAARARSAVLLNQVCVKE